MAGRIVDGKLIGLIDCHLEKCFRKCRVMQLLPGSRIERNDYEADAVGDSIEQT